MATMREILEIVEALRPYLPALARPAIVVCLYLLASRALVRASKVGWLTTTMEARLRVLLRWFSLGGATLLVLEGLGLFSYAWATISAVAAALAVGFVAHWSLLSNWASAVLILAYQRFSVGDEIEILEAFDKPAGLRGKVIDINLVYTTVVSSDETDSSIQIPNSLVFQKPIRVFGRPPLR